MNIKTHQIYSYSPIRANKTSEKKRNEARQTKHQTKKGRSDIEETMIQGPRALFSNISKMASSIIAANLQNISTQHYQSRKEPNSHP